MHFVCKLQLDLNADTKPLEGVRIQIHLNTAYYAWQTTKELEYAFRTGYT